MKSLVLVNGDLYRPALLRRRIRAAQFDLVLAADAGARHAAALQVHLDAVIGDMDSIANIDNACIKDADIVPYPAEKNETDLELALLYARRQGADSIVVAGVMGGRMDMTMANMLLLAHPKLSLCRIEAWHGNQTAWIVRPPGEDIPGNPGDILSLLPLGCDAVGVTVTGVKYPLKKEKLFFGAARGLSNELVKTHARVRLSDGMLLAIHTPGRQ